MSSDNALILALQQEVDQLRNRVATLEDDARPKIFLADGTIFIRALLMQEAIAFCRVRDIGGITFHEYNETGNPRTRILAIHSPPNPEVAEVHIISNYLRRTCKVMLVVPSPDGISHDSILPYTTRTAAGTKLAIELLRSLSTCLMEGYPRRDIYFYPEQIQDFFRDAISEIESLSANPLAESESTH